jgi:3-polyprenyl-4-hydroxybenzoate decarboxylase
MSVYERGDEMVVLDGRGRMMRLPGEARTIALELLARFRQPQKAQDVLARLGARRRKLASQVLSALQEGGVLVDAGLSAEPSPRAGAHVLLALTGGMAAAHAPALTEMLLGRGFQVRIAATPSSLRFVSVMALEALTHAPVVRSRWPADTRVAVPHLELARWADVVVVPPTTATTLSRIARGDCSTLVSAVALSTRAPVILAPAMNESMLEAPAVRRNLAQVQQDGFIVMQPSLGYEVASAPADRAPSYGAAPTVQSVALVVEAVLGEARAR